MIRWLISRILGFRGMSITEARDWAAILYTPVLTFCAVGQVLVIWLGPWPESTAALRLQFLGWGMIVNLGLIGLGTFFLQRRTVNLKGTTPGGGSFEVENISQPEASA